MRLRVLTAADLHQSRLHYDGLALAVKRHEPDVVALVGDFLYAAPIGEGQYSTAECARLLAELPVKNLLVVKGNHEDINWQEFVYEWPFDKRPLTALYGTGCAIGPLVIVGFPCKMGSEFTWCETLPKTGNDLTLDVELCRRKCLPADTVTWLPGLMRLIGPPGRTLWLMHEPPMGDPIAASDLFSPDWSVAVERYSPLLTVSGHDHETPLETGKWWAKRGETACVNVGQTETELHYCLIDLEFPEGTLCLPAKVSVTAFPKEETFEIGSAVRKSKTGKAL